MTAVMLAQEVRREQSTTGELIRLRAREVKACLRGTETWTRRNSLQADLRSQQPRAILVDNISPCLDLKTV